MSTKRFAEDAINEQYMKGEFAMSTVGCMVFPGGDPCPETAMKYEDLEPYWEKRKKEAIAEEQRQIDAGAATAPTFEWIEHKQLPEIFKGSVSVTVYDVFKTYVQPLETDADWDKANMGEDAKDCMFLKFVPKYVKLNDSKQKGAVLDQIRDNASDKDVILDKVKTFVKDGYDALGIKA